MRDMQQLRAEARLGTGKGAAFRVRQKGLIPGVVYGGDASPETVSVPQRELERHVSTGTFLTTPFMLQVNGSSTRVIPRDVQLDPVTDRPVHVDFMRLKEGTQIVLAIPVRFRGQENSPGIKRGGVLNVVRHEIELLCPVENIPESIEANLSGLEIHGTLHISDIKLPEGVVPMVKERDFTIASIVAPTSVIEEARAAAAAATAAATAPVVEGAAAPAEGAAAASGAAAAAPAAKAGEKK
ncbi:MAG TPA: 50S ribosomal protein L25/general stress protein Ctc [Rhizomicrobium sp.]|jgi:large subunit ribosomal protein L25